MTVVIGQGLLMTEGGGESVAVVCAQPPILPVSVSQLGDTLGGQEERVPFLRFTLAYLAERSSLALRRAVINGSSACRHLKTAGCAFTSFTWAASFGQRSPSTSKSV